MGTNREANTNSCYVTSLSFLEFVSREGPRGQVGNSPFECEGSSAIDCRLHRVISLCCYPSRACSKTTLRNLGPLTLSDIIIYLPLIPNLMLSEYIKQAENRVRCVNTVFAVLSTFSLHLEVT